MAGDWIETNVGELLSFTNGQSSPERADGLPYPVYGSNGIIGYASEANADNGAIIIGRVGSYCGSLYQSAQKCWVTDNAIRAVAKRDHEPRFLFYLLGTLALNSRRTGSGQPLLNQDILSRIPAVIPGPAEQRAIVHVLGTLDDKIKLNYRHNLTLEAMALALFQDWLIDFGPVRAQMEGREAYLPTDLWQLFPDRLNSEGKPEGWEVRSIGDFAELKGGKQLQKERIAPAGPVPVFGGAGVMGYTDSHNADGFVIAVGRVGAYCGQFFAHRGKAWINNNASLIRQTDETLGEWLFLSLRHADIDVIKKGAAQPFVSNSDIAKLPLVWPGEKIVRRFRRVVTPFLIRKEKRSRSQTPRCYATRYCSN
ncbi:MAG: restriction endonuclease subunit S [Proteobacteria bacterium]|nr:restriction endonuclease subunit S [Pseudomonadota bacterium]